MTTEYSFHYEGERRIMWQDAVGDPWTPEQAVEAAGDATWIDVCALTRTDFPPETLAALAAGGRQLLVDLQGLVRTATIGPLHTDAHIGDVLRHIEVLKLNDEEARDARRKRRAGEAACARRAGGDPHARLAGRVGRDPERVEHVPAVAVDGPSIRPAQATRTP